MVVISSTQSLASYLPAALADFVPSSSVQFVRSITKLTSQCDDFADDQLRDTTRITKRGIKDSDAVLCGILRVNLICANAEAANDNQVLRFS